MQETELFIHSAEIAGVFVGFGALIAIRNSAGMEVTETNAIRWVMTTGIWVVVVALAPLFIASYGPSGHELWLASSVVALCLLWAFMVVYARTPENRAEIRANLGGLSRREIVLELAKWLLPSFWIPVIGLIVALALVVLGLFPDHEEALYLSAVGLGLFMSALGLFVGVFEPRRASADAVDPPAPAPGRPDA